MTRLALIILSTFAGPALATAACPVPRDKSLTVVCMYGDYITVHAPDVASAAAILGVVGVRPKPRPAALTK